MQPPRSSCREVRRVTPETAGFLDPSVEPAYGILAHANLGHAIQYKARRPTATDPFWAFIGPENWDLSFAFLSERDETKALELARKLSGRFVLTTGDSVQGSVVSHLHHEDGKATKTRNRLEHFRLISEARRRLLRAGDSICGVLVVQRRPRFVASDYRLDPQPRPVDRLRDRRLLHQHPSALGNAPAVALYELEEYPRCAGSGPNVLSSSSARGRLP